MIYVSDKYQRAKSKQGKEVGHVIVGKGENLDTLVKVTAWDYGMAWERCPAPNPWSLGICQVTWQRELKLLIG